MICKNCGTSMKDGAKFCPVCGTATEQPTGFTPAAAQDLSDAAPAAAPAHEPVYTPPVEAPAREPVYAAPVAAPSYAPAPGKATAEKDTIPEQYRPLSPWAYFGLQILFSIPIVGFIFLIVFSCSKSNINRRNFARSYWCALLIVAVILVIFFVIAAITGIGLSGGDLFGSF